MIWLAGLVTASPGCRDAPERQSEARSGQPAPAGPRDTEEIETWEQVDVIPGPSRPGGPLSLQGQSNPGFCGLGGCAYRVMSESAEGRITHDLPHALSCRFAEPQRRLPVGSVTCIQRIFTGIAHYGPVQVEVDYQLGTGGFSGSLDHLARDALVQDCRTRAVTAVTPLYLLPVDDVRFRAPSRTDWTEGPPRIGVLEPGTPGTPGTIVETNVSVIDPTGREWLRVGAEGWVRAEALPCG